MLFFTLVLVISLPLIIEVLAASRLPSLWPALRWGVVPPLGALLGAAVPMGVLPMEPVIDALLSLVLGAMMGALIAIYGLFRELCFTGPSVADVARSGRRSAYHGPVRI